MKNLSVREREVTVMNTLAPIGWLAAVMTATVTPAVARDTEYTSLKFADVLAMPEAQQKLDPTIKLFFGDQVTPKVLTKFGKDTSSKKANGVGKDDEAACRWAALSALMAFQAKAKFLGANAVVGITSSYNLRDLKSATDYECHAGALMAGVSFKATYVKVEE